jgi:hypothetical protein
LPPPWRRIHARHFVLATHPPAGFNLVQAEMEVYREYGVAVPVANPPAAGIHGSPIGTARCAGARY